MDDAGKTSRKNRPPLALARLCYLQNGPRPGGATVVVVDVVHSALGVFAFLPAWWKAWCGQGIGGRWRLNRVKRTDEFAD